MKPNYELRVGLFTIIALILFIWGWGWLKSASLFHNPQTFTVSFHDVAGLNKNATVNINGVRVGIVEDIQLVGRGQVHVLVRITAENVVVPEGSLITIQTLGLVGAKYVEITLPEPKAGQPAPAAINKDEIVVGQDPVRVELIVNDLATKLSKVVGPATSGKSGSRLSHALERSGEMFENISEASAKLNQNMDRIYRAADSFNDTSVKIGKFADRMDVVATSAQSFFDQGANTMQDIHGTTTRVNKILNNPAFSSDLKETVQMVRKTADTVQATMHELNATVGNKDTRADLNEMLSRLDLATENIYKSLQVVNKLANDQGLRTDIKEAVLNAKEAVAKADALMGEPNFRTNIANTLVKVKSAATNVDIAARQLSAVLDKRAPLIHMMFGRPGKVPKEETQAKNSNQTD